MHRPAVIILTALIVLFAAAGASGGGKSESENLKELIRESKVERPNPHTALGCRACHGTDRVTADSAGKVPFKNGGDIPKTCYECHDPTSNIHPVGQLPSMTVPAHLPLDEGRVSCNTCHDLHVQRTKDHLLRGFNDGRYTMQPDLCIDCHGATFIKKNPHVNQKERGLCVFCHQTEPTAMDTQKTVQFRFAILKICNFCHNMVEANHPVNVSKDIKPPASLPRDVDGSVTCATCHNPHGSADTLHFLRREYIVSMEASRNFNPHKNDCLACHKEPPAKGTSIEAIYAGMKYNGRVGLLCNGCHGSHSVHPVDIAPAKGMSPPAYLPLDGDGKIDCITCHDMNCGGGEVKLRLFDEKERSMKALCYSCHDENTFKNKNPHKGIQAGEDCLFCHERQPDKKSDTASTVSFIASLRMICLRCHDRYPHPAGFEHLIKPEMEVPKDLPLDKGGLITCITCHNPHIGGEKGQTEKLERRERRPGDELCDACHVRMY